jgi:hypothetical protein
MSVWTPAHDENVAQASCLHERRLQARCLRYIFVVIFLSTGSDLQRAKRFSTEVRRSRRVSPKKAFWNFMLTLLLYSLSRQAKNHSHR